MLAAVQQILMVIGIIVVVITLLLFWIATVRVSALTLMFSHLFDTSVGMTGVAELSEVDGPFVKIRLKGRFWHERSLVLARLGNYMKERIPEILEVDIEDEKQLDDSPENF
ncbi:hypothetical protein Ccrd_011021 [Cynara cardunculus var. scolymus]|uniref:Uncharacterized protein n=1 Tax=Cynara cardunculus var. scolymus TaxID=59895 RepID=A0A103YK73_CYNCS|nr:hypothetical protein Ccrd_011021 [Cynara cardunculus var. scolymus]